MSVYGETRPSERKKQDDGGRFGANAVDLHEPVLGFVQWQVVQKIQFNRAPLLENETQRRLNARPFLVGQSGGVDGLNYLGFRCEHHAFPIRVAAFESVESFVAVGIGSSLGEDGTDQFVYRGEGWLPFRFTIELSERLVDGRVFVFIHMADFNTNGSALNGFVLGQVYLKMSNSPGLGGNGSGNSILARHVHAVGHQLVNGR